ncbi:MAG TPA: hypothetical protein VFH71_09020 [Rhodanobacteraceae bacterium]|nr:hypothetical protein [Rhodanobacteraceae bacterium]
MSWGGIAFFLKLLGNIAPALGRLIRPDISGQWYFEYEIKRTEYNPYRGMRVQYVAELLCNKNGAVVGTSEKLRERVASGAVRSYTGRFRDQAKLQGQLRFGVKRFAWCLDLHVEERGEKRMHSAAQQLRIYDGGEKMLGSFFGTAANSEGEVLWKRDRFLNC